MLAKANGYRKWSTALVIGCEGQTIGLVIFLSKFFLYGIKVVRSDGSS